MVIMLFSGQVAYAKWQDAFKSKTWWVNKVVRPVYQNQLCPAGRFVKKSIIHDRIYNLGYKKVLFPVGRYFIPNWVKAPRALKQGNYDEAIGLYTKLINYEEHSGNFRSLENLNKYYDMRAYAYYKKGNITQAVSDFNNALKINTNDTYAASALREIHQ
jgi:tetratricopeptide (TPR) repeat protein